MTLYKTKTSSGTELLVDAQYSIGTLVYRYDNEEEYYTQLFIKYLEHPVYGYISNRYLDKNGIPFSQTNKNFTTLVVCDIPVVIAETDQLTLPFQGYDLIYEPIL